MDTNVLVSGLISPHGAPGRIVDAVVARRLTVLYDDRILAEYREVLRRPKFAFDPGDVAALLDLIERDGEPVIALPIAVSLPDPDDLPFVEVAAAAHADALVTGNARHYRGLPGRLRRLVRAPAALVADLARREPP